MAAYCTQADVVTAAGRTQTLTTAEITACAAAMLQATAMFEKATGTWFDSRHLAVTTEAVQTRQRRLFLPAPVISLDSVVEGDATLTLGTDFYLYQPRTGPGWIEKAVATTGSVQFNGPAGTWTTKQQGVVVSGTFGYSAVPTDVVKATAYIAAQILNWVTVSYQTGDGVAKAVLNLKLPDWVNETIRSRTVSPLDEQYFGYATIT